MVRVPVDKLTDAHIEDERKGFCNVVVALGSLGGMRVVINPSSAKDAIARAARDCDDDEATVFGFNGTFYAYDVSPKED